MLPNRQAEGEAGAKRAAATITSRTAVITAVIAACTALASVGFNYWFTDRTRTAVAEQTAALEKIKTDVAQSAQRTAETLAGIDAARLDIQRQVAAIDASRLDLQREAQRASIRYEDRRIGFEDAKIKADRVRLGAELSLAQNDVIPVMLMKCTNESWEGTRIAISCSYTNQGKHRITVLGRPVVVFNGSTDVPIEGGLVSVRGNEKNTVPAGISGTTWLDLVVTDAVAALPRFGIRLSFDATTDEAAVSRLLENGQGLVKPEAVRALATQGYISNNYFKK